MVDTEKVKSVIVKGLCEYLGVPMIRTNQTAKPPKYPYLAYTITTVATEYNGTWAEYADGYDRKPTNQTWSITALSDDSGESVTLASKARTWLDRVGSLHLSENNITVQKVMNITNRDNILTAEYQYSNGFDVVFALFDEVQTDELRKRTGTIESADILYKE